MNRTHEHMRKQTPNIYSIYLSNKLLDEVGFGTPFFYTVSLILPLPVCLSVFAAADSGRDRADDLLLFAELNTVFDLLLVLKFTKRRQTQMIFRFEEEEVILFGVLFRQSITNTHYIFLFVFGM